MCSRFSLVLAPAILLYGYVLAGFSLIDDRVYKICEGDKWSSLLLRNTFSEYTYYIRRFAKAVSPFKT